MIQLYSGTPGSGKSLHVARDILFRLRTMKKSVIATFPINVDLVSKKGKKSIGEFLYKDISEITTDFLISYALKNHKLGTEGQTLVIIDECQIIFNPREFSRSDRLKWITFFTQHRKLGFHFVLISQFDRLIDRQIRCLLEYNVIHRKINNFGFAWMLPFKFFIAINKWYGANQKSGIEFFTYRKKYGKMYDSFMMFDDDFKKLVSDMSEDSISDYNREKLGVSSAVISSEKALEDVREVTDEEVSKANELFVDDIVKIFRDVPEAREIMQREDLPEMMEKGLAFSNVGILSKLFNVS